MLSEVGMCYTEKATPARQVRSACAIMSETQGVHGSQTQDLQKKVGGGVHIVVVFWHQP